MRKNQNRTIVVDFASESNYQSLISQGKVFLEFVMAYVLSLGFQFLHKDSCSGQGNCFTRHSHYMRIKCGVSIWRIQCVECGAVFTVIPSFLIRYFRHRAEDLKNALIAYHGGLSFENCRICFNISGSSLYRFICNIGKNSIPAVLCKAGLALPVNLWADEKHSECQGVKGYIPLMSSGHSIWNIGYTENADDASLEHSYGSFAQETRQIESEYLPDTVSHDGYKPTENAMKRIFGYGLTSLLCWLHACWSLERILKPFSKEEAAKATWNLLETLKKCHAKPSLQRISLRSHFTQMLRKYREILPPNLYESLEKWIARRKPTFYASMDFPLKLSFGYSIDHICNHLDRKLFMMKHFHHKKADKTSFLKGFALLHEFIPYQRFARNAKKSPAEADGASLPHSDWFVSLLILLSGGYRQSE